eukprot:gene14163-15642_t
MASESTTETVIKGSPMKYVKLNVGGSLFYTTIGTLTSKQGTMLEAMFSGRMEVLADNEGWILVDRSGKHFGTILNYLRDGTVPLPEGKQDLEEFLAETKFYLLEELSNEISESLSKKKEAYEAMCKVPLITSAKEEKLILNSTTKPVIKLVCNRYSNKYSYTSQSDDNLLKNMELFDKLSLRFSGRILFMKDIIANDEICCWSFYGSGKKIAEACCTSIVYSTEKKQTKVDFPEARIYEETLNILLFENNNSLDAELLRATKRITGRDKEDVEEGRRHRLPAIAIEN